MKLPSDIEHYSLLVFNDAGIALPLSDQFASPLEFSDIDESARALSEMIEQDQPPDAILIATSGKKHFQIAYRLRQLAPWTPMFLVVSREQAENFAQKLPVMPVMSDVQLICCDDRNLNETIDVFIQSGQKRQRLHHTLARINERLSESRVPAGLNKRLMVSDRYLAHVLAHAPDAIISTDMLGRIVSWNEAATTLFERNLDEVLALPIHEIFPHAARDEVKNYPARALAGETIRGHKTFERKLTGRVFEGQVTLSLIRDDQLKPLGMSLIVHDISVQIAAQRQAERASRAKDEFLMVLSHELRTPLTSIVGWTSMLKTAGTTNVPLETAIDAIHRNALIQSRLVDDLLDVSTIVSGKMRLVFQPQDLTSILQTSIDSIRPAATSKKIDVRLDIQEAAVVVGDRERLQQVFWNLLSNSIKFTPSGGRVDVVLHCPESNTAEVVVRDTGKGITADFLPYIFERFTQSDTSQTRQFGGLGLGLAIVRHLIELHGGSVRAESAGEGTGTSFFVRLPLAG